MTIYQELVAAGAPKLPQDWYYKITLETDERNAFKIAIKDRAVGRRRDSLASQVFIFGRNGAVTAEYPGSFGRSVTIFVPRDSSDTVQFAAACNYVYERAIQNHDANDYSNKINRFVGEH